MPADALTAELVYAEWEVGWAVRTGLLQINSPTSTGIRPLLVMFL